MEMVGGEDGVVEQPAAEVLTVRSIVFGLLIGTVTTMENIYFALKYSYTVTNNISAAILGFGVMKTLVRVFGWRDFTPQENCVLMTVAVAATAMVWGGSMPFAILAMSHEMRRAVNFGPEDSDTWEPTIPKLIWYSAALCFIGFFLAIPLRRKFVVEKELPFPYALAAAKTISSLHSGTTSFSQPIFLVQGLVPAMAWGMLTWSFDGMEQMPLFGLRAKQKYQWQLNLSVAPLGRGLIVPKRYILSELLGAAVASGVLLPLAERHKNEWYDSKTSGFEGKDAYYLMPAILAVAFDSVYQLSRIIALYALPFVFSRRTDDPSAPLLSARTAPDEECAHDQLPTKTPATLGGWERNSRWLCGWALASFVALFAFRDLFNTRYDMAVVALLSSPLWSVGITMAVGMTGSNVASSCGKVMIMAFAAWYGTNGHVVQTLALGALSIAVIDQALDLVRDFKTAYLLRASPSAMFVAQSIGAVVSIFTSAVLYYYYVTNVSLPNSNLPAVISKSYRALAFTFAGGLNKLPDHCLEISVACGALVVLFNIIYDLAPTKYRDFVPSGIAFGVGIFLLPGQILIECIGLLIRTIWRYLHPKSAKERDELLGAALLAGDGLAGVLQSLLDVAGVSPPYTCSYRGWYR